MAYYVQLYAPRGRRKTFELRRDDRAYSVGDILHHQEISPTRGIYTGRNTASRVLTILRNFPGLESGYCIMSIQALRSSELPFSVERYDEPLGD